MEKDYGLVFTAEAIREKGGLAVKKPLDPEIFAATFDAPARVKKAAMDLVFFVGDDSLVLEGRVSADLELQCARCGELFTAPFAETFDEAYEDAVESIDVRGPLIESVAVMMPLKPLCAAGCKGLCQVCGGNRNLKACACAVENEPGFDADKKESPFKALKDLNKRKDLK
ncbi:MAG: YceD family protein [Elusimicrobiota bacterium]